MDMFFGFDENKLKPYLKMSIQRIQIIINKKTNQAKQLKREVAALLKDFKEEKARIKVEHIIREDFMIESYEILELLCELVHERTRYLSSQKECPLDLIGAISSIVWAEQRVEISELADVKKQFKKKYGSDFIEKAKTNAQGVVNERLFAKLSYRPPSALLITRYLEEIAKEYSVQWTPTDLGLPKDLTDHISSPMGFSIPMAPASDLSAAYHSSQAQQTEIPASDPSFTQPHTLSSALERHSHIPNYTPSPVPPYRDPSIPLITHNLAYPSVEEKAASFLGQTTFPASPQATKASPLSSYADSKNIPTASGAEEYVGGLYTNIIPADAKLASVDANEMIPMATVIPAAVGDEAKATAANLRYGANDVMSKGTSNPSFTASSEDKGHNVVSCGAESASSSATSNVSGNDKKPDIPGEASFNALAARLAALRGDK